MPPGEVSSRTELEQLREQVKELDRRLSALEHSFVHAPTPALKAPSVPVALHVGPDGIASVSAHPSILPVLGTAVLGVAGAYVLRAVAESGICPSWTAVTLALLYAAAWLVWAAWPGAQGEFARQSYAITAAVILVSLLWEATVGFRMLAPPVTAGVLAAFAALAIALAWRTNIARVAWVGVLTAVITAVTLMIAARALVPFTAALLAVALLVESAALAGRWLGLRPVVAAGADFAVLILVLILGNSATIPPDYKPASASLMISLVAALFAIYATSISIRTLAFRLKVTIFDAAQLTASVLLAIWAVLRITNGTGDAALGALSLAAGAACYSVAFGVLARHRESPNLHFYSVCGIAFVMAGSFLALPSLPLVMWLCSAAVIATALGVYARSPELDLQGVAYLSGAVVASGLLDYAGLALAGAYPGLPRALPITAAAACLLCAAMISRYAGEHPSERVLRLLPAILAVYAIAALIVTALAWLVARGALPTHPQLAVVRTVVTCAAALLLALVGARCKRRELVWMAYAAALLGSLKLALEDLRFGTTQSLAVSLLIYGAVLILIPRFARARKRLA
jgi:hypothetical protein